MSLTDQGRHVLIVCTCTNCLQTSISEHNPLQPGLSSVVPSEAVREQVYNGFYRTEHS